MPKKTLPTLDDLSAENLGAVLGEVLAEVLKPMRDRLKAIAKRLDDLELRGIEYLGVHKENEVYRPGSVVTHKGGMWVATQITNKKPGSGEDCGWRLAVKSH